MISLDAKIFDPGSRAATRMGVLGRQGVLHILVPTAKRIPATMIAERVSAEGVGGGKARQFFRLVARGRQLASVRQDPVGMITAQDPFFTALAGFLVKTGKKIRFEVQSHGDFYGSDYYKTGNPKQRFQYLLGKWLLRRADAIRVPGERVRQSLLALGIAPEKIVVRPVIEDLSFFKQASTHASLAFDLHRRYPEYEKIFLVLARFDPVKNIPWLVDVFAAAVAGRPRYGLVIVGEGKDRGRIEAAMMKHGLARQIRMEPWTVHPRDYLMTADCLLFPSLSEGYGLVVVEAVAAGTPVIMTDVGVANYEVRPEPGKVMIVPVGDAHAFKEAIMNV